MPPAGSFVITHYLHIRMARSKRMTEKHIAQGMLKQGIIHMLPIIIAIEVLIAALNIATSPFKNLITYQFDRTMAVTLHPFEENVNTYKVILLIFFQFREESKGER